MGKSAAPQSRKQSRKEGGQIEDSSGQGNLHHSSDSFSEHLPSSAPRYEWNNISLRSFGGQMHTPEQRRKQRRQSKTLEAFYPWLQRSTNEKSHVLCVDT